jgi:Uma2 family endonuclease
MKVRVDETGLHAYPDLSGLCGTPEFADDEKDVLLNPALIIEVLSPGTESYDRGAKFHHYQRLASLRQYVLVSQEAMRVELYTRQGFGEWLYRDFTGPEEVLPLGSVGAELRLAEIYERVELSGTGEA